MVEWRWCDLEEYHVLSLNYLEYFIFSHFLDVYFSVYEFYDYVQYMFALDTDWFDVIYNIL